MKKICSYRSTFSGDAGYILNGPLCEDINECSATTSPCSVEAASCTNTDGSFTCSDGLSSSTCNSNGICEAWADEDCFTCPSDCNAQNANHCCGRTNQNTNAKPCGHPSCTVGSFECGLSTTAHPCCAPSVHALSVLSC